MCKRAARDESRVFYPGIDVNRSINNNRARDTPRRRTMDSSRGKGLKSIIKHSAIERGSIQHPRSIIATFSRHDEAAFLVSQLSLLLVRDSPRCLFSDKVKGNWSNLFTFTIHRKFNYLLPCILVSSGFAKTNRSGWWLDFIGWLILFANEIDDNFN